MSARPMSEARRRHIHGPIVPLPAGRPRRAPVSPLILTALRWVAIGLIGWWLA